mgnify:CR=1 FL=1
MNLFYLSRIYVTAVEFFEMEHSKMLDSQTLNLLISELEVLNKIECKLSKEEHAKVKYILLILKYYGIKESIDHIELSNNVIRIKNEINV